MFPKSLFPGCSLSQTSHWHPLQTETLSNAAYGLLMSSLFHGANIFVYSYEMKYDVVLNVEWKIINSCSANEKNVKKVFT